MCQRPGAPAEAFCAAEGNPVFCQTSLLREQRGLPPGKGPFPPEVQELWTAAGRGAPEWQPHFEEWMMMIRTWVVAGAIASAVLAGCGLAAQTSAPGPATGAAPSTEPAAPAGELAVTQADNGKTLQLGDRKTIVISLAGNATTGYAWSVSKVAGTALQQDGEVQYVPLKVQPGMVGSGGVSVAKFRAVKAGQSTIRLEYARPWEHGVPPAKTFEVTIVVDQAP